MYRFLSLLTAAFAQSCQPLNINSNAAIHETELFFPSWSAYVVREASMAWALHAYLLCASGR